jgi:hypothetical protein
LDVFAWPLESGDAFSDVGAEPLQERLTAAILSWNVSGLEKSDADR